MSQFALFYCKILQVVKKNSNFVRIFAAQRANNLKIHAYARMCVALYLRYMHVRTHIGKF